MLKNYSILKVNELGAYDMKENRESRNYVEGGYED